MFFNAGKNPFEIISFPFSGNLDPNEKTEEVIKNIDKLGVQYGKVQVRCKNIAIVPANHFYIISYQPKDSRA